MSFTSRIKDELLEFNSKNQRQCCIRTKSRSDDYLKGVKQKPPSILNKCCKKTFLREAFLFSGSASTPEKSYYLDIASKNETTAVFISDVMNSFGLNPKTVCRNEQHVVYIKEGEGIVNFLNIIGAHSALMSLENVRIQKEMRNSINRIVNFETANLDKTVNASVRQIKSINYIKEHIGFDKLPTQLQEIAKLRLENSEISLSELGKLLDPPLSKSGVNHRLRKLNNIADASLP